MSALRPGDLVMIPGALGTMARPGHVGMYLGYGLVVHAPRIGDVVRFVKLTSFIAEGLAGLRHIA
jgi:cell wall-associated NlpC family hydrolase